MNDELTTQASPAPIVLKLKKYDDIILPHTSRLTTDSLNDSSSSSFIRNNESHIVTAISPPTWRVKLKKPFINGSDDEYIHANSSELTARSAKRSKKSLSNDNISDSINNDQISSQQEMNQVKQDHCIISEQSLTSPLVLKIRRDSLTSTIEISPTGETETNRQLLLKLKKNEYGELTTTTNSTDISSSLITNNEYTNGHNDSLYQPVNIQSKCENKSPTPQPHITNMLSNLTDDKQWNNHQTNSNQVSQPTTTTSHVSLNDTPAVSVVAKTTENQTKELFDEALDSVKNVLMQTFKKNLELGGDLNALKNSLGSDEVAEVFLAKLRESLKRDTIPTFENEQKSPELISAKANISLSQTPTPSPSSNTVISPMINFASSPSSSPLLPSISTMIIKNSTPIPSSPKPPAIVNNKRKSSNPSTNPNRFDGITEDELTTRFLSDILQPNLDIVFVGINPSLYAVHKGHHYGGPGNHFWKLLHMSDLISSTFTANDDYRMPQYGIGLTNIVQRPTKAGSDITKDEITAGAEILMQKIKIYRPKIVAFNGRGIYEVYAGNKHFHYGKQPDLFPGTDTHVFVMPSSSARCSQLPRAEDKLPFYVGLRKLRDFVNGTLHSLNEAEITFPDIKIKDTDDVLQKTVIRISNKAFSELSPETLKPYGTKFPSAQMILKQVVSSTNLALNSDTLATQTISILSDQQNGNLLNYDQYVYLQNNGNYSSTHQGSSTNGIISSKTSFIENTSSPMANHNNDTDTAVLAALVGGPGSSSFQSQQPQTIYVGRMQQSGSSPMSNNFTGTNSRSATPPSSSHTIHHLPQPSSTDHSSQSIISSPSVPSSSNSQLVSHQLILVNPNEPFSSKDTILNSFLSQDSSSSQYLTHKQILTAPTILSSTNTNYLKASFTTNNTTEDCLFLRYESESSSLESPLHFSYVIDEYSSSIHKRLRYVSINDL